MLLLRNKAAVSLVKKEKVGVGWVGKGKGGGKNPGGQFCLGSGFLQWCGADRVFPVLSF